MNFATKVREFHKAFGIPALDEPGVPAPARVELRRRLQAEEGREVDEALASGNLAAILHELADLQYVIDGTLLEHGLLHLKEKALVEIHRANMSKLGADGKPIVRADGKVLKGPNFKAADIASLLPPAGIKKDARISECGRYRHWLTRRWDERKPLAAFIMLNPSTADADIDDPTVRRCMAFAKAWGYGGIIVVNLFQFRATDPKELRGRTDLNSATADETIIHAMEMSFVCIAAWGALSRDHQPRALEICALADQARITLYHLGLTSKGYPRHPLYLSKNATRVRYC